MAIIGNYLLSILPAIIGAPFLAAGMAYGLIRFCDRNSVEPQFERVMANWKPWRCVECFNSDCQCGNCNCEFCGGN